MRTDSVFRMDNTYEVWKPVITQDAVTNQVITEYQKFADGKGLIISGAGGTVYLSSRDSYPVRAAVRFVRDRNDTPIFSVGGDEYDMYIISATPEYDGLGTIVGWRHSLRRELPRDLQDLVNGAVSSLA